MKDVALVIGLVVVSFFMAGCGDLDSEDSELTSQGFEARISGRWRAPQNLIQEAGAFNIRYTGAGPWRGTSGCGGSFSQGASFLKTWVKDAYPQVTSVGGYSCRRIRGGSSMSVHATGRAIDIHFPLDRGQADNGLGDPVANYFLEHADEMGVQLIIWDRSIWSSSRSGTARFREYTGQHPHHDHIHLELTPEAAQKRTPWFSNPSAPGSSSTCSEITPAQGGTVDNTSDCFTLHGNHSFWRTENAGFSGSLRWTNAFESNGPSNWAEWHLNLVRAGKYRVYYYSEPQFAKFDSTRYSITHGVTKSEVFVDLSAGGPAGWKELGTFDFKVGAGQSVAVFDDSPVSVAANQHIIADAIRIEPVDVVVPDPTATPRCGMVFIGGGTIDNKSDCFEIFGEARFWREQRGGYGGTFLWTNAFSSSEPSNWAKWNINLEEGGLYDVYYYSIPNYAKFRSTRYEIKHSGQTDNEVVDLRSDGTEGWKKIGTYNFAAGHDQWVSVFDNSNGFVGRNQSVIVDSIRLLPIGTSSKVEGGDVDVDDDIFEEEIIDDHFHTESNAGHEAHPKDFQIDVDESPDDILVETGCATQQPSESPAPLLLGLVGMFLAFRRRK